MQTMRSVIPIFRSVIGDWIANSLLVCCQALTERAINPGREVPSVPSTLLAGMNVPPELAEQEGRGIYYQNIVFTLTTIFLNVTI
mgnify:CR=1 FL=1